MKAPISLWILISSYILSLILYIIMFINGPFYLVYPLSVTAFLTLIALVLGLPLELVLKGFPTLNKFRTINFIYYATLLTLLGDVLGYTLTCLSSHILNRDFFFIIGVVAFISGSLGSYIIAAAACLIPIEFILIKSKKLKYLEPTISSKHQKIALYILSVLLIIIAILFYLQIRTLGTQIMD